MKRAITLFLGLICIAIFAFSTRAGRFGEGERFLLNPPTTVVAREWKGRIASARDNEYYPYLLEGVKKIRSVPGSLGVQVMRRSEEGAVQYTVISYWESREAIKAFAGQDIEKPHHLPRDRDCSSFRHACFTMTSPILTWRRSPLFSRERLELRRCARNFRVRVITS